MDIRKIIREEVDDFDWVSDVTPTFYDFWENDFLEEGDILTLRGETLDMDGMPVFLDGAKYQIKKLKRHFLSTMVMFDPETQRKIGVYNPTELVDADGELIVLDHQRGGTMDMGDNVIREDDGDDFDWVRDSKPTLGDLFERGLIEIGDTLILNGHTEGGMGNEVYVNNIPFTFVDVDALNLYGVSVERRPEHIELFDISDDINEPFDLMDSDRNLTVVKHIKAGEPINESEMNDFVYVG